ncbi:ADP-ribosylation factor-like protein 4C, partial [Hetaerina americana]|uniref:ADP-ribosylation factor-like protein 4C n=1 Tax=Hetaerina americana TaxID=62018 RepID=UPI003A7F517A
GSGGGGGGGGGSGSILDAFPPLGVGQSPLHVVMLGLDSAGKTTALYRLKFEQYVNTVPTIGFNCERVRVRVGGGGGSSRAVAFLVWDVGGQERLRPLWRSYTRATDGIVFVVDSGADAERMDEAKMELMRAARSPENAGVPLLVVANKQDLPGAREPAEVERALGLLPGGPGLGVGGIGGGAGGSAVVGGSGDSGGPLWHVQPACAITGEGLAEGMEALYEMIIKRRKMARQSRKKR